MIEREIGLRTFVESGVALDAAVSRDLLCAVFHQGGALHDGAVIVQGDRVAAAACFLPLTTNPVMQRRLGTRHRAAIGITEETDALAVVVSEETRQISIASRGDLEPDVTLERVRERLTRHTSGGRSQDGSRLAERRLGAGASADVAFDDAEFRVEAGVADAGGGVVDRDRRRAGTGDYARGAHSV